MVSYTAACTMSAGAGLLTTLHIGIDEAKWIAYQFLYGLGTSICFWSQCRAVQVALEALPQHQRRSAGDLVSLGGVLGQATFASVGQNVLVNELSGRFSKIMGGESSNIPSGGVTSILNTLPTEFRAAGIQAYNEALQKVFQIGTVLSCLLMLGFMVIKLRNF